MAGAADRSLRYATGAWARTGFRMLERGAPPLAVRLAVWRFCKPKRRTARAAELRILAAAQRRDLRAGRQRIVAHSWGRGPLVVLHHGWGGNGAQMATLAAGLVRGGYSVAVLDARAHGESPGSQATLPLMASDLALVAGQLGAVEALVGHSMGAMICARAMQLGLPARRVVMLAAPSEIMPYLLFFQSVFGLRDATVEGMLALLHARFGLSPAQARADQLATGRAEPLLLLHDRDDPDVPLRHPEAWAKVWPGARLELTAGLGHRRILRDERVAARVLDFVSGEAG